MKISEVISKHSNTINEVSIDRIELTIKEILKRLKDPSVSEKERIDLVSHLKHLVGWQEIRKRPGN